MRLPWNRFTNMFHGWAISKCLCFAKILKVILSIPFKKSSKRRAWGCWSNGRKRTHTVSMWHRDFLQHNGPYCLLQTSHPIAGVFGTILSQVEKVKTKKLLADKKTLVDQLFSLSMKLNELSKERMSVNGGYILTIVWDLYDFLFQNR